MKKGFTYGVAPRLIAERPGMTADEVAQLALNRGLCRSDSKTPVRSLAATLAKEVREGRHTSVRAERSSGILRYYPVPNGLPKGRNEDVVLPSSPDETVSIRIPGQHIRISDDFVEAGKFKTRSEALAWFVGEGIRNNKPIVDKVKQAVEQIRGIKKSLVL